MASISEAVKAAFEKLLYAFLQEQIDGNWVKSLHCPQLWRFIRRLGQCLPRKPAALLTKSVPCQDAARPLEEVKWESRGTT